VNSISDTLLTDKECLASDNIDAGDEKGNSDGQEPGQDHMIK
jgi:hypothetical protein